MVYTADLKSAARKGLRVRVPSLVPNYKYNKNKMISIIVPTMWKFAPFIDFASQLVKLDVVGELIIINNDSNNTPDHPVLSDPKVKIFDFGRNIYVNPAWNLGAEIAKHDILCILNDDLIFDLRLLYKIEDFMTSEIGVIGLSKGLEDYGQTSFSTGEINFELFQGQNAYGFGELMFVHKSNWEPIPNGLNIGFGEVFIFEKSSFNQIPVYFITNLLHYHKGSTTVGTIPKDEAMIGFERERALYESLRINFIKK